MAQQGPDELAAELDAALAGNPAQVPPPQPKPSALMAREAKPVDSPAKAAFRASVAAPKPQAVATWLRPKPAQAAIVPAAPEIKLSAQQEKVCDAIGRGRNVLVTGAAGTGKSTILNWMKKKYGERGIAVTASTGIAAVNVGGLTINSWAGLGLADDSPERIAAKIQHMEWPTVRDRIKNCMRLAIDEVSMISAHLLNLIDAVFKIVRDNPAPFGGIQMIFFGDFLQLPPVIKGMEEQRAGIFAFQSRAWAACNVAVAMLTQVFRQADAEFSTALNSCRVADYTPALAGILRARYRAVDPNPEKKPVIIHTHNKDVDEINRVELEKIKEPEQKYAAIDTGKEGPVKMLQQNCLAPTELVIKIGARVMLLWNVNTSIGLANGSVGTVTRIAEYTRRPWVMFDNGIEQEIENQTWEIKESGKVLASRTQCPLRLAWAITAHKSQGMTLDKAQVHLADAFEYGQAYVALSRVKTTAGLFIQSGKKESIKAHPLAVEFYQRAESVL